MVNTKISDPLKSTLNSKASKYQTIGKLSDDIKSAETGMGRYEKDSVIQALKNMNKGRRVSTAMKKKVWGALGKAGDIGQGYVKNKSAATKKLTKGFSEMKKGSTVNVASMTLEEKKELKKREDKKIRRNLANARQRQREAEEEKMGGVRRSVGFGEDQQSSTSASKAVADKQKKDHENDGMPEVIDMAID